MERRLQDLWMQIPEDEYVTSNILAGKLFLSEKTIRQDIKRLNDCLSEHGAVVESKHGYGFQLVILEPNIYQEFVLSQRSTKELAAPVNAEERIEFILAYLLFHRDYVQIEELCGSEFNLRACITNYVMKRGILADEDFHLAEQEKFRISKILRDVFVLQEVSIPELSFQNLILHMYTGIKRLKKGFGVTFPEEIERQEIIEGKTYQVASIICNKIEEEFHVHFNEDEILFITIHLSGKRITSLYDGGKPNLVISEEIFRMVEAMLESVYQVLQLDLRDNFAVKMALAEHMVSLEIRIKYHMELKNPLLEDIRKNYSYAYTIAVQAVMPVEKKYVCRLTADELGYIALIFELSLQESSLIQEEEKGKKNILVVCATGKTSAELLAWQYKHVFGKYLDKVEVCNIGDLADYPS